MYVLRVDLSIPTCWDIWSTPDIDRIWLLPGIEFTKLSPRRLHKQEFEVLVYFVGKCLLIF